MQTAYTVYTGYRIIENEKNNILYNMWCSLKKTKSNRKQNKWKPEFVLTDRQAWWIFILKATKISTHTHAIIAASASFVDDAYSVDIMVVEAKRKE